MGGCIPRTWKGSAEYPDGGNPSPHSGSAEYPSGRNPSLQSGSAEYPGGGNPSLQSGSAESHDAGTVPLPKDGSSVTTTPSATSSTCVNEECPVCLDNPTDMVFGCGHQICCDCGGPTPRGNVLLCLSHCPICRIRIRTRVKLSGEFKQCTDTNCLSN